MKAYGALGPDDEIGDVVEVASFDDTLGENKRVVEEILSEDQILNSDEMYEVIAIFEREIWVDRTARVDTKYKNVDQKVRPVAAPMLEGRWERIKGVATNPIFRDLASIGHRLTDKTLRELKIGWVGFLLSMQEDQSRRMLKRHWKAFTVSLEEIGTVDPTIVKLMVIFTVPHVAWSVKMIQVPRAHIPKLMELLKQKVELGLLESLSAPYSNR